MKLRTNIAVATFSALFLCGSATASHAISQSMPGVITGVITGAPLPDGIYNIIDLNWGARGPYKGGAEVDSTLATPLHFVGFLPFRLLDGTRFLKPHPSGPKSAKAMVRARQRSICGALLPKDSLAASPGRWARASAPLSEQDFGSL